jgi:hypothetical protein
MSLAFKGIEKVVIQVMEEINSVWAGADIWEEGVLLR